jgi:rubrerythrin
MKDRVQEIKELIDQLKEAKEVNLKVAKDLRETDQEISFFYYKLSDLIKKAEEDLKRQMPVTAELDGGGHSWWYVCGECHTAVDYKTERCPECGRRIKWN